MFPASLWGTLYYSSDMLQEKDYLIRKLKEFFLVLDQIVSGQNKMEDQTSAQFDDLYEKYFALTKAALMNMDHKQILNHVDPTGENPVVVSGLAELIYQDALNGKANNNAVEMLTLYKELMVSYEKITGRTSFDVMQKLHFINDQINSNN